MKSRSPTLVRRVSRLAPLVVLTLAAGCMHPGYTDAARTGPFYVPANHLSEPSLGGVRRVVLLPIWTEAAARETMAELDPVIVEALQQSQRFEVVTLPRDVAQRRFKAGAFPSTAALPHDLLETLKRDYAAEGVLFIDVTVFRAYRPLAIGLRGKLATIDGTRLLWTFDNVFSADDAKVANSARNHFLDADRRVPADLTHGVLQSPSRFASYAAAAMFATLPPVLPPPPPAVAKRG